MLTSLSTSLLHSVWMPAYAFFASKKSLPLSCSVCSLMKGRVEGLAHQPLHHRLNRLRVTCLAGDDHQLRQSVLVFLENGKDVATAAGSDGVDLEVHYGPESLLIVSSFALLARVVPNSKLNN